jgi:hypothetical protein
MTPLPSSRVPLLLEITKNTKPACSAAKIRGRAAFCHGGVSDWVFWRALQKQVLENFDRSTFQDLLISMHFLMKFAIPLLLTYRNRKTQKLTKTSENNKAKGLTSANQGVQIHHIWHSSYIYGTQHVKAKYRIYI